MLFIFEKITNSLNFPTNSIKNLICFSMSDLVSPCFYELFNGDFLSESFFNDFVDALWAFCLVSWLCLNVLFLVIKCKVSFL